MADNDRDDSIRRQTPIDLTPEEFRAAGYQLVDQIADFLDSLPDRRITSGGSPGELREQLGQGNLPAHGTSIAELFDEVAPLLFNYSLHNGHPRFLGYITSSAAPGGMLGDLLAASVNANLGKWDLAPMATEIEAQTVRWLADLVGYPTDCGGLMVSGGNMANFIGFFAARAAKAAWPIREEGLYGDPRQLRVYGSRETHTWIQKATDLAGLGTDAIRWIDTDGEQRIRVDQLEERIDKDLQDGNLPFFVAGTAGNVSTGAIDPLRALADLCQRHDLWFHVDGAYGAPAACLGDAPDELQALERADSVALDPHKWLYSPIEAGCALVRDASALPAAFRFDPAYYAFAESEADAVKNYYQLGFQNSRGFRALKVWLGLRQVGRNGYEQLIREDITLAEYLFSLAAQHPELQPVTCNLSIATFRYVPPGTDTGADETEQYLNELNERLVVDLQGGGEVYVSNAIIDGCYSLRACVVNFRTSRSDMDAVVDCAVREGRRLHTELRAR